MVTFRELFEIIGLAETHDVWYVALQLRRPAKEWWGTYLGSFSIGSPGRHSPVLFMIDSFLGILERRVT